MEVYATLDIIKYLHKYIYKRVNQTIILAFKKNNKIINYKNAKYISLFKAFWRLIKYNTY